MSLTIEQLTKNLKNVDIEDILSCWQWLVADMKTVITISCLGDMFLLGKDNAIYWLQTDTGKLTKAADSFEQYQQYLNDEGMIDTWFLPLLVERLLVVDKTLKDNEVYSYIKPPVLGGEYTVENIAPTSMSVHFAISGQMCEQIKDLPDGTRISNVVLKRPD